MNIVIYRDITMVIFCSA